MMRVTHGKKGKKWTRDEEVLLAQMANSTPRPRVKEMANALATVLKSERTCSAVETKLKYLGLCESGKVKVRPNGYMPPKKEADPKTAAAMMDAKFCAAMSAAIAKGLEHMPAPDLSANDQRYTPLVFASGAPRSNYGSPAAMCAENANATE